MKKRKYLFLALIIALLIIILLLYILLNKNIGKLDTLTCSNTQNYSGMEMKQSISIEYKNKKINKIEMKIVTKAINDTIKQKWDDAVKALNEKYNEKEKIKGIKVTTDNKKENYSYSISIKADLNTASEKDLEKYNLKDIINTNETLEDIKKDAENNGFTCK